MPTPIKYKLLIINQLIFNSLNLPHFIDILCQKKAKKCHFPLETVLLSFFFSL